ncbi:MAG: hypothetical protein V4757_13615 [Pseudomonadota bacterium]
MTLSTASPTPAAPAFPGRRLHLGADAIVLDRGGVAVIRWPDAASLASQVAALCDLAEPVVRVAGGALMADLSLQDNLMLEPALRDGVLPAHLLPEIDTLLAQAGCPVDWERWALALPQDATPLELAQVRIGRALMADPDLLLVDDAAWDHSLLPAAQLSRAFASRYPWRMLVWATHDAARADSLRACLQEFTS